MALKNLLNKMSDIYNGVSPEQQQKRAQMEEALGKGDYPLAKTIEDEAPGTVALVRDMDEEKSIMQVATGSDAVAKEALIWNAKAFDVATSEVTEDNATLKLKAAAILAQGQHQRVEAADNMGDYIDAPARISRADRLSNEATDMAAQLENVSLTARAMQQNADLYIERDGGDTTRGKARITANLKQVGVTDAAARTKAKAALSIGASADSLDIADKVNLLKTPDVDVQKVAIDSLGADKVAPDDHDKATVALAETAQQATSPDLAKAALDKLVNTEGKPENYNVIGNSYSGYTDVNPEVVETVVTALGNTLNNHPQLAKEIMPDWNTTERTLEDINRFRANEHYKAHGEKYVSQEQKDIWQKNYAPEIAADFIAKRHESIPPLPAKATISDVIGDDMGPKAAGLRLYFADQMQNEPASSDSKTDNRPRPDQTALAAQTAQLNGQVIEDTLVDDATRNQAKQNLVKLIALEETQAFKAGNDYATIAAAVAKTPYYPSYAEKGLVDAVAAGAYDNAKTTIAPFANAAPINPDDNMKKHQAALQATLQNAHETGIKADLGKGRAELDRLLTSPEPVAQEVAVAIAADLRQQTPNPAAGYAAPAPSLDVVVPRLVTGRR